MAKRPQSQSHHLPVRIPFGEKSEALWSISPTGNAVIFVHGFGGGAVTTWLQFPSLLQQEKSLRGHDLIFYGYDGKTTGAQPSAYFLIKFLNELFMNPGKMAATSLPGTMRKPQFKYKKVVIVAHSFGAIVSRLALVNAFRKRYRWTPRVQFVFFAPAHSGAPIIQTASLVISGMRLPGVEAFARFRFLPLLDLEKGSPTLIQLTSQTRAAIRKGATNFIARCVVHANHDPYVYQTNFCEDPPPDIISATDHLSVCKPRPDFFEPLTYVLKYT